MPDTPPPSTGRRTGRISAEGASLRRHGGVRRAPEPFRSGRGGAGLHRAARLAATAAALLGNRVSGRRGGLPGSLPQWSLSPPSPLAM